MGKKRWGVTIVVILNSILFSGVSFAPQSETLYYCDALLAPLGAPHKPYRTEDADRVAGIDKYVGEQTTAKVLEAIANVDALRRPHIKTSHINWLIRNHGIPSDIRTHRYKLPDGTRRELTMEQIHSLPENVRNWLELSD